TAARAAAEVTTLARVENFLALCCIAGDSLSCQRRGALVAPCLQPRAEDIAHPSAFRLVPQSGTADGKVIRSDDPATGVLR
ncbi:hypothetical protein ACWDSD_36310, partial [Streptomyces spiralis]